LLAQGEFALAKKHLEIALELSGQPSVWGATATEHDLYTLLADAAARQRNLDDLLAFAPQAEALAARFGHALNGAIAARARGVAHRLQGEYEQAEARLKSALSAFSEQGTHWQRGRTLFELGEVEAARANPAAAQAHYLEAMAAFEAVRAGPDVARARIALQQLTETH
jgi:tetratricopeptide (TPR) repeat protein